MARRINVDDIECHRCQSCGNLVSANQSEMRKTDADKYLNGQNIIPNRWTGEKRVVCCKDCIKKVDM